MADPHISVILPAYNEEESLSLLLNSLFEVLDDSDRIFEILVIDDGSQDTTYAKLTEIAASRAELKIIRFRHNTGQTAALVAGIDHASADTIVTLDADLQNDPHDIPKLLAELEKGYDVVSGWRKDRKDSRFSRNLVSRIANSVISKVSGVKLHDYGCTLKAYRKEVLEGMRLYGEMHRFIPIYASWMGAKITEIPVRHHKREFGKSKYGLERTFKVILDLMVTMFLSRFLVKPIYVFGGFAFACLLGAGASFTWMLYLKVVEGLSMIQTPLPTLTSMFLLVGAMSLMMGILAEILIRTYFESRGRPPYDVRETVNLNHRT